jgi:ribose transport system permease protein
LKGKNFSVKKEQLGLLIGVIALFAYMSIFADDFFSWYNIHNIIKDTSILLIVATGMTLAILLGKIDMSAGSVMSLSAIVVSLLLASGVHIVWALLIAILSGALIGLLNGYLIGVQKLDHFVSTFATLSLAKGIALVLCDGDIINTGSNSFKAIGASTSVFLGLHVHIWIVLIIFLAMMFLLYKTRYGSRLFSVGGSEQAAVLAGIKTKPIYISAFIISGVLAAIGGILIASKANNGNATIGNGFEFKAIATVIIGGTPFEGGKGGLGGTLIGAFLISILQNGLRFLGVTPSLQYVIIGLVILVVIIIDVLINERRVREELRRVEQ